MGIPSTFEDEADRRIENADPGHISARLRTNLERAYEQRACEYFDAQDRQRPVIKRQPEATARVTVRTVCIGRRAVEVEEFEEPVERELDTLDLVGGPRVSLLESIRKQVNARWHQKGQFR